MFSYFAKLTAQRGRLGVLEAVNACFGKILGVRSEGCSPHVAVRLQVKIYLEFHLPSHHRDLTFSFPKKRIATVRTVAEMRACKRLARIGAYTLGQCCAIA
jgi:hypothetical protein